MGYIYIMPENGMSRLDSSPERLVNIDNLGSIIERLNSNFAQLSAYVLLSLSRQPA